VGQFTAGRRLAKSHDCDGPMATEAHPSRSLVNREYRTSRRNKKKEETYTLETKKNETL